MTIACHLSPEKSHSQHNRRAQRKLRGLFLACLAGFVCNDSKGVSMFKMLQAWAQRHVYPPVLALNCKFPQETRAPDQG